MGIKSSRTPQNIIGLQEFEAEPDVAFFIKVTEIVFLMPIWRKCGDRYVDATGDYDLCLSANQENYEFINRRADSTIFAYRFYSTNWLATRKLT